VNEADDGISILVKELAIFIYAQSLLLLYSCARVYIAAGNQDTDGLIYREYIARFSYHCDFLSCPSPR
jgi:hypothetical protein